MKEFRRVIGGDDEKREGMLLFIIYNIPAANAIKIQRILGWREQLGLEIYER